MFSMKVKDIMIKDVIAVSPDDSFYEIVELFSEKKISGAPVAIGDKAIGMVSETDIMKFISKRNLVKMIEKDDKEIKDRAALTAKKFMTKNLIKVKPSEDIAKVIVIMNEKDINRVPVEEKGKLVGIITRADIVSVVSEYLDAHPMLRKRKLETDEPTLETNIDKFLLLVKEKGSIKFADAAKKFSVSDKIIEEWGKILEDCKLVNLHYPPIGDPTIKIMTVKHGKKKKK